MTYVDNDGNEVSTKRMGITESILDAKRKWDVPGQEGFKVEIKREDHVEDKVKATYDFQTHANLWGIKADGLYDSRQLVKDENYHLTVTAAAVKSFQIERTGWFADEFVSKDKPFVDGCSLNHDDFFDKENGSLHLIPTSVLVIYKPKIVMNISSMVYEKDLKAKMHGGMGLFNLFGLTFNMDAGASMRVVNENAVTSITFDSPSNVEPQLLGILSAKKY